MATIVWPLLVTIFGGGVWGFAGNGKAQEAGRIAFAVGLFWMVYLLAGKTFHL